MIDVAKGLIVALVQRATKKFDESGWVVALCQIRSERCTLTVEGGNARCLRIGFDCYQLGDAKRGVADDAVAEVALVEHLLLGAVGEDGHSFFGPPARRTAAP